jgi:hypothetical protein
MSMKNSNDTIGIRSRDFPVCSAASQNIGTVRNDFTLKCQLCLATSVHQIIVSEVSLIYFRHLKYNQVRILKLACGSIDS